MKIPYANKETGKTVELSIDDKVYEMLTKIVERIVKHNNEGFLIITGDTGTGKTTYAATIAAVVGHLMNRTYSVKNVYFDSDKMVKDAIASKEQIFHYDEALFSSMAVDWQNKAQKNLIKMLLLCRKKKHFFIFCIPDFFKLKDTIAVEKSVGLIRCYLRDGIRPGKFVYYKKKAKDAMYAHYKKSGIKEYRKFWNYRGNFSNDLAEIINENAYEDQKDKAIMTLADDGKEKVDKSKEEIAKLEKKNMELALELEGTQEKAARKLGISLTTLKRKKKAYEIAPISLEIPVLRA